MYVILLISVKECLPVRNILDHQINLICKICLLMNLVVVNFNFATALLRIISEFVCIFAIEVRVTTEFFTNLYCVQYSISIYIYLQQIL